jgi:hypothetical protein
MFQLRSDADGGVFDVHVASGHASWGKEFLVTTQQAAGLVDEPPRCDILFALLHTFEQRGIYPFGQSAPRIVQKVALGHRNSVRKLASKYDGRGDISVCVAWVRGVGRALGPGFETPDWFADWKDALKDRLHAD